MLLVVYDISSEDVISRLRDKAKEFGEMKQILPSSFLLDTSTDLSNVNQEFLDIVSNNGRIIISQIRRNEVNGWLSTESVNWINSKSF